MNTNGSLINSVRIVGISGSLRGASLNTSLLEAACGLAPDGVEISILDVSDIPFFNEEIENDDDRPASVDFVKEAIAGADGVLIATPEYNGGIPGVLKNVIDWVSRPPGTSNWVGKPVGIMGASPGALGTARAQEQLKLIMLSTRASLYPHPGVVVGNAKKKLAGGRIIDDATAAFVARYVGGFTDWARRSTFVDVPKT